MTAASSLSPRQRPAGRADDQLRLPTALWFLPLAVHQPVPLGTDLDALVWGFMRVMAAQVAWLRIHAGWSDEHAAGQCGVSGKTLRRFQYGEGWPSLRAIITVAAGFDATVGLALLDAPWPAMPWTATFRANARQARAHA